MPCFSSKPFPKAFEPLLMVVFELSLGLAGLGLAWWFELWRFFTIQTGWRAWGTIGLTLLPMVCLALLVTSSWGLRFGGFRKIYEAIQHSFIGDFVRKANVGWLICVAFSAGIGEEILFRIGIQPLLGFWGTALLFGCLHAISWTYFLVAFGVGIYLGWVFQFSEGNIFVPIMVHSLYDLIAFLLYRRAFSQSEQQAGS